MENNVVTHAREFYEKHKTHIWLGAMTGAAIATAYYIGKSKGELNLQIEMMLQRENDLPLRVGNPTYTSIKR